MLKLDRIKRVEARACRRFEGGPLEKIVNPETISYVFWGVMTTLLNWAVYYALLPLPAFAGENYIRAHDIGIVVGKVSAYFANKFFVFQTKNETKTELAREIFRYCYTRAITFLLDHYTLRLLVEVLGGDKKIMKLLSTWLTIVANYLFGKFLVFKKRKPKNRDTGIPGTEEHI